MSIFVLQVSRTHWTGSRVSGIHHSHIRVVPAETWRVFSRLRRGTKTIDKINSVSDPGRYYVHQKDWTVVEDAFRWSTTVGFARRWIPMFLEGMGIESSCRVGEITSVYSLSLNFKGFLLLNLGKVFRQYNWLVYIYLNLTNLTFLLDFSPSD